MKSPAISAIDPMRPAISSYWRKNTAMQETDELARLLKAMRKVAGHLGSNVGRIAYDGMFPDADVAVRIDPGWVMGEYPVPPEKVDHVVGYVVDEALRRIEWSGHVWKVLEPVMENMTPRRKMVFQTMAAAGEDNYLDFKAGQSVFGLYTAKLRKQKLTALDVKIPVRDRSLDELILAWRAVIFNEGYAYRLKPAYEDMLGVLKTLGAQLFAVARSDRGAVEKCRRRAAYYLSSWQHIGEAMIGLPVHQKRLYRLPGAIRSKRPPAVRLSAVEQGAGMTPVLAREIEASLAADATDITPLIRSVAGYDNDSVASMSRWDFNMPSRPVIDRRMIGRLKAALRSYAASRTLVSRGLQNGKIDRARLYRAALNGRCFRETHRMPDHEFTMGLLVDASGSMCGRKWQLVESIVANLYNALACDNHRLAAWGYFESGDICMISRLVRDGRLRSLAPSGKTASGQAIIAAALMMPKHKKQRILIHITDGESNFGCDVSWGIELCRQENIQLLTIGCGDMNRDSLEVQYGQKIQFVDHFEQLPRAIENLVRSVLK